MEAGTPVANNASPLVAAAAPAPASVAPVAVDASASTSAAVPALASAASAAPTAAAPVTEPTLSSAASDDAFVMVEDPDAFESALEAALNDTDGGGLPGSIAAGEGDLGACSL